MSVVLQKVPNHKNMLICLDDAAYNDLPNVAEYKAKGQSTGTETMLRTWWNWMSIMSTYMRESSGEIQCFNGSGKLMHSMKWTKEVAHEVFTAKYLGLDDNGLRYSWKMVDGDQFTVAPSSKRLYAMEKLQADCAKKGIILPVKENSEFFKMMRKQEE